MKKRKIYFADLTHTSGGISVPTFPLGTGLTASYTKKELGAEVDVSLFKFPEALHEAIQDNPPDILCLSAYSWCFELGYQLGSMAKKKNKKQSRQQKQRLSYVLTHAPGKQGGSE